MSSLHKVGENHNRETHPSFTGIADGCPTETVYGLGIPVICHESDSVFRCLVIPTNPIILGQIQFGDSLLVVGYRVYKTDCYPTIVATVQLNLPTWHSAEQFRLC